MRLVNARVQNYRSIEDSGEIVFENDVTCLVGKNESGKTAVLQALHLLNPLNPIKGKKTYDEVMDYPSRHSSAYKRSKVKEGPANVLTATFRLDDGEFEAIERDFGAGVLQRREVIVTKGYGSGISYDLPRHEEVAVAHKVSALQLPADTAKVAAGSETFADLLDILSKVEEPHSTVKELIAEIEGWRDQNLARHIIDDYLHPWLPRFFYFDDYNVMKGDVSIPNLREKQNNGTLTPADQTFLSLLATVNADLDDLENNSYEAMMRELEGAANGITDDVMRFWSQNKDLEVFIDVAPADPSDEPPLNTGPVVHVRIRNQRHRVTVPFDERSRGFVWFFSFFAYFSNIEVDENRATIILLDEPGLNLHATAQGDFLRFIQDRLADEQNHQVIYSTHSPFLIQPNRIDRVRTVQDVDNKGTKVSSEVYTTDSETLFPLQGALGYDLAQTLFVGPNCLLVEGPSDLLYLQLLSQACEAKGRSTLDDRWTVTPVGGADKLSTFVSLIGANQLNVAVLMDSNSKDRARVATLQQNGRLASDALILVSEVAGQADADLEDLFTDSFYLDLVNGAYKTKIKVGDLTAKGGRIVARVEKHFQEHRIAGGALNHYKPSAYLLREQVTLLPKLSDTTLVKASALFDRINALIC
ncbi:ATP-dependent nuclease [Nocardioides sp.]|uniref:ATP-dependent nuclease n=1 Tax=Nocardioides sp. TaxID=35761 RepID=UPI002BAF4380|nr:AAA family ATPase [Nocardioides sp.]HSX66182.1 AAA family ATPase [Nocardioides sp.]